MDTIKELEQWMSENNISNTFTPGARYRTDEGLGLEEIYGIYIWYFIERGERQDLRHFKSEKEAVNYVRHYLQGDK